MVVGKQEVGVMKGCVWDLGGERERKGGRVERPGAIDG